MLGRYRKVTTRCSSSDRDRQHSRIFRFGGRRHSTILKEEFHRYDVSLEVKQSQRGRVGTQLPCNGSHHLPNEVIQLVRSSPARVQWTQIVRFVNRHLTLSTAYSRLFAGYYLTTWENKTQALWPFGLITVFRANK